MNSLFHLIWVLINTCKYCIARDIVIKSTVFKLSIDLLPTDSNEQKTRKNFVIGITATFMLSACFNNNIFFSPSESLIFFFRHFNRKIEFYCNSDVINMRNFLQDLLFGKNHTDNNLNSFLLEYFGSSTFYYYVYAHANHKFPE